MKLLSLITMLLVFSDLSYGRDGLDRLFEQWKQASKSNMTALSHRVIEHSQCANFSGQWQGQCTFDDKSHDSSLEIKQPSCNGIYFDGVRYSIGGMNNTVQSPAELATDESADSMSTIMFWNSSQSELRTLDTLVSSIQNIGISFSVVSVTRFNNEHLVIESIRSGGFATDGIVDSMPKSSCVYNKVSEKSP